MLQDRRAAGSSDLWGSRLCAAAFWVSTSTSTVRLCTHHGGGRDPASFSIFGVSAGKRGAGGTAERSLRVRDHDTDAEDRAQLAVAAVGRSAAGIFWNLIVDVKRPLV